MTVVMRGGAIISACLALSAVAGCERRVVPMRFPTQSSFSDDEPRRPAGVASDPALKLPAEADMGSTEANLVVLKAPPDTESARAVVREFMKSTVSESASRLAELLDQSAIVRSRSSGRRENARSFWNTRITTLNYGDLAGQLLYRDSEMETYRREDLSGRRSVPVYPQADEIVVRVKILTPKNGKVRLFGDELVFRLKPTETGYLIREIVEDFQLK